MAQFKNWPAMGKWGNGGQGAGNWVEKRHGARLMYFKTALLIFLISEFPHSVLYLFISDDHDTFMA